MAVIEQTSGAPHIRPAPPPLRIHHLMACAAVAAVQLSLWRASFTHTAEIVSLLNAVLTAIGYGLSAIGLTLAIFSIYWQRGGFAGLVQPGQWLLVRFVFLAIQFCVAILLATLHNEQNARK